MRLVKKILVLAAFLLPLTHAGAAYAQGSGLSISPTRAELEVAAGSSDKFTLKIKNVTGNAITAKLNINDFTSDGVTGEPKIAADDASQLPTSIKGFLTDIKDIDLEKDETKDVDITVSIPAETNPGAYYGIARYTAVPKVDSGDGQVSLAAGIGVVVLITVPGNVEQKISVTSLQAERDGKRGAFFTKAPNNSIVTVRNIGTGFAKPYSKISINYMGKEVYSYDMNNQEPRANILPNSAREFKDEIKNVSKPGKYTIKATTSIFVDNASSDVLVSESTFWYVPMWMLIALGVLLLALLLGGFLAFRKFRR